MRSIAIFPCSFTEGAGTIGQLSGFLHLRVFTDEMLFLDISEQFGIPVDKVRTVLCRKTPELNRCKLEKTRYLNLARCSLEARRTISRSGRIHYGLHTSLLDSESDRVIKVLVHDEREGRIRRAMQQEGFSRRRAEEFISRHDEQVSAWTRFLFNEDAYAPSLYDLVISCKNRKLLDITAEIEQKIDEFEPLSQSARPTNGHPAAKVQLQLAA
jgi:two-component system, OmpR family, response regulator CpxR